MLDYEEPTHYQLIVQKPKKAIFSWSDVPDVIKQKLTSIKGIKWPSLADKAKVLAPIEDELVDDSPEQKPLAPEPPAPEPAAPEPAAPEPAAPEPVAPEPPAPAAPEPPKPADDEDDLVDDGTDTKPKAKAKPRCPKGTQRNKKTGECEPKKGGTRKLRFN
jgi:hypothetical protein